MSYVVFLSRQHVALTKSAITHRFMFIQATSMYSTLLELEPERAAARSKIALVH